MSSDHGNLCFSLPYIGISFMRTAAVARRSAALLFVQVLLCAAVIAEYRSGNLVARLVPSNDIKSNQLAADLTLNSSSGVLTVRGLRFQLPGSQATWWAQPVARGPPTQLSQVVVDEALDGTPQLVLDTPVNLSWSAAAATIVLREGVGDSEGRELGRAMLSSTDPGAEQQRRRLLQSGSNCNPFCVLEIDGVDMPYCYCKLVDADSNQQVYWDAVVDDTMSIAFAADSEGYAALGFPSVPGMMVGADAVVVQADASADGGATVAQYSLEALSPAGIVPNNGLEVVGPISAWFDGSRMAAAWQLGNGANVDLSGDTLPVIYAVGGLSGDAFQYHDTRGTGELELEQGNSEGSADEGGAPAPGPVAAAPAPTPAPAGGEVAAPAPAPDVQEAPPNCALSLNGNALSYDTCTTFDGTPITFFYDAPNADEAGRLRGALRYEGPGWGAVAFAASPGVMIGASAVVVAEAGDGAVVNSYSLNAKSSAGVVSPGGFVFTAPPEGGREGDALVAVFEIDVSALGLDLAADLPLLYAHGQLAGGRRRLHQADAPVLLIHESRGSLSLNLADSGGVVVVEGGGDDVTLKTIHGVFMAVAFGVLFPIGIGSARCLKFLDPAWFWVHVTCQLGGYMLGLAGWIMGWIAGGGNGPYSLHRGLGIAVVALFTCQLSAIVYRPTQSSRFRRTWNLCHWWIGRVGLGLAVWNIYYGLLDVYPGVTGNSTTGYVIAFSIVFGGILGFFFLYEALRYAMLPPPADVKMQPKGIPADAGGRYTGRLPDEAELQSQVDDSSRQFLSSTTNGRAADGHV